MKIQDNKRQMSINIPRILDKNFGWKKGDVVHITSMNRKRIIIEKLNTEVTEMVEPKEPIIEEEKIEEENIEEEIHEQAYKPKKPNLISVDKIESFKYKPKPEKKKNAIRIKLIEQIVNGFIDRNPDGRRNTAHCRKFMETCALLEDDMDIEFFYATLGRKELNETLKIIHSNVPPTKIQAIRDSLDF